MTNKILINMSLIQDFDLSDKAIFAYGCLAETYQFTAATPVSVAQLNRTLFGNNSKRRQTLRKGLNELEDKGLIVETARAGRTPVYDLTGLSTYHYKQYVMDPYGFITQWRKHHEGRDEHSRSLTGLYKTYLTLKWMLDIQKSMGAGSVLKTYKVSIAKRSGTQRCYVNEKLQFFKDNKIFEFVDLGGSTFRGRQTEPTIYLTEYKDRFELDCLDLPKAEVTNDSGFYGCQPVAV